MATEKNTSDNELMDALSAGQPASEQDKALFHALGEAKSGAEPIDEMTWARLKRSMKSDRQQATWWRAPSVAPWQMAASVAAALLLSQALPVGMSGSEPDAVYRTVGEVQDDTLLKVAFSSDAREADIREIFLEAEVQIVAGPSLLGFYELAVAPSSTVEEARTTLSQYTDVIEYVERSN